jgi:hypothetical protein
MKKITVYELREIIKAIRESVEYIEWLQSHQFPSGLAVLPGISLGLKKSADKLEFFIDGIEVKV